MKVINKKGVTQAGVAHPDPGIGQALLMKPSGRLIWTSRTVSSGS